MGKAQRLTVGFILFLFVSMFCISPAEAADYCDMAREVAAKAAKTFPTDKEKGVKLFIKALKLCQQPLYQYNLGIAYYQYGNAAEAEKYLAKAVAADDSHAKWLGDYAAVILARGGDAKKALKLAEKASRLAGDGSELGPAIAETCAEARFRSGQELSALKGIQAAARRWPAEPRLQKAAARIESRFVQTALQLMRAGREKEGFAVLEKGASSSSLAAQTLCRALSRAGQGERALAQTVTWKSRYPEVMKEIWTELVAEECGRLYARYQAGERAPAMQAAKILHEKYSENQDFKETYDKLFNAYINDDTTIILAAKTTPVPAGRGSDVDVDRALESLFGGRLAAPASDLALEIAVDQDKNIRSGRLKRPHGIAVVIGNQHYAARKKGLPDVAYAGRDAVVMEKYLVKTMGFNRENIISSLDASGSDLRVLFGTPERPRGRLYNFVKSEKGKAEVFIYYTGHGAPAEKGGEAYLVPVNADVNYIETSGYPLSLFYRNLEALPAKSVMVVLDACFSGDSAAGHLFKNISPAMLKNISPIQELQKNSFVLCGADKDQVCSWYPQKRHSLLTYYFFEALQGKADENDDNRVTAQEVYSFVRDQVSHKALRMPGSREQNPLARGNFNLVLAEFR